MKEIGLKKNIFDKMTAMRTSTMFPLNGFCICIDSAFMVRSTPTTAFDMLPIQCRHIEHMHEGVWLKKDKMTAMRTKTIFSDIALIYRAFRCE